jgi:hypothetical protein
LFDASSHSLNLPAPAVSAETSLDDSIVGAWLGTCWAAASGWLETAVLMVTGALLVEWF